MSLANIDHVVVLMLENRSFDSLLGWAYEGSDKPSLFIPDTPGATFRGLQATDLNKFLNKSLNGGLQVKPTRGANGFTVPDFDPGEEFAHVTQQFFNKANPGPTDPITMLGVLEDFVEILKERKLTEADIRRVAGRVMQSYTPAQLPVLNQLARHYAVSDAWYASAPSQTNPNRSFLMCGTSMGMVNNGDLETNPQARDLEKVLGMAIGDDRVDAPTIFNALNEGDHDWRVFWQTSYLPQKMSNLINGLPILIPLLPLLPLPPGVGLALAAVAGALLLALKPYTDYLNDLCSADLKSCYTWRLFPQIKAKIPNAASHFSRMDEFHRLARAGRLPKFSYIEPFWSISRSTTDNGLESLMSALGNDYHPPSNLLVGEAFVKEVYTSLISNRAAWNRTLLLITFDEFVGVFDHQTDDLKAGRVKAPWDGGQPPPFKSPTGFKFDRLGARVPTIIVSPLVKKGTVFRSENGVPYDHTSVIASTLKWVGKGDKIKDFGQRTLAAPTFENVVTLDKPRSDATALPFLDTQRFTGDPVRYGESFVLKSQDGKYLTSFYPTMKAVGGGSVVSDAVMGMCIDIGAAANFPTYGGGDKARLSFITTAADPAGQIAHNSTALLVSREPGLWARNTLGAWKDSADCYYDNEYLDGDHLTQQTWTIQKLDNTGQPLRYGDRIYLVNGFFGGQRLTRTTWPKEGWVTTKPDGGYWTIEPAEARVVSDGPWQGAPSLKVIAASQQGGSRAQQLWGVDDAGQLRSIYQEYPGGPWSGWSGPWRGDSPAGLTSLAACQQNDGRVQLWGLGANHALYSIYQTSPGGDWSGWSGAGWNGAPPLKVVAASQQGGSRGAQLWGIDLSGQLRSTYQETAGGSWVGWSGNWRNAPGNLVSVAVCQQNNGACRIWIVDGDGRLYSTRQTTPGGDWEAWSPPSWGNPPPLAAIACSQQGGTRGGEIWAVDRQGVLHSNYAENNQINSPWSGWSSDWYGGSPRNLVSLAACQQNDGTVRLWGVDGDGVLYSIAQKSPGGDWTAWSPSI